jgi:hypothetical protein
MVAAFERETQMSRGMRRGADQLGFSFLANGLFFSFSHANFKSCFGFVWVLGNLLTRGGPGGDAAEYHFHNV